MWTKCFFVDKLWLNYEFSIRTEIKCKQITKIRSCGTQNWAFVENFQPRSFDCADSMYLFNNKRQYTLRSKFVNTSSPITNNIFAPKKISREKTFRCEQTWAFVQIACTQQRHPLLFGRQIGRKKFVKQNDCLGECEWNKKKTWNIFHAQSSVFMARILCAA